MLVSSAISLFPPRRRPPINRQTTKKTKRLNQALYYLDFCWCMNFTAIFVIGLLVFVDEDRVSNVAREAFFNGENVSYVFLSIT